MKTVVIGIGNAMRGDDAAGIAVAKRLRGAVPPGVVVVSSDAEPSRLIETWEGMDSAVLVDTVTSGAPAGTLHRFDAVERPVEARAFRSSTHAIGLAETIELARALGKLPQRVVVHGIEGAHFETGAGLSWAVEEAVARLADLILTELKQELCTSTL